MAVPAENLINNCRYYNAEKACTQCNTNYVLTGNQCLEATAKNCLTFTSVSECKTCLPSYYRKKRTDAEITDCIFKEISYCATLDPETGNCSACQAQYYVDSNGICKLGIFINKCIE